MMAIAIIGFFVWGHHMFTAGISIYSAVVFSLMTFFVAVPSAIKVFNWTATPAQGLDQLRCADALCARLRRPVHDRRPHRADRCDAWRSTCMCTDTYFVIAHFHYIMVGGTVSAFFGGLHYWWPKITGRLYPEMWARMRRAADLRRLQPHLLPAIHPGLSRHAAALLHLSAGMAVVECAVLGRRLDPRRRLYAAARLSRLVAVPRRAGPGPTRGAPPASNGRPRRRRPEHNFDRTPGRDRRPLPLRPRRTAATSAQNGAAECRSLQPPRCNIADARRSRARRRSSACGCSSRPRRCSSAR